MVDWSKIVSAKELVKRIETVGVSEKELLAVCPADLQVCGQYGYIALVLTAKKLLLVTASRIPEQKVFAGYGRRFANVSVDWDEADIAAFLLDEVETLTARNQIAGVAVDLQTAKGTTMLCCATGQYAQGVRRFCRLFQAIKEGKEPTQEDYQEEERPEFCEKCGTPYVDRERKICPKCMDHRSLFMRTFSYFLAYKGHIFFIMLLFVLSSLLNAVLPYFSGAVYFDDVLAKKSTFTGYWSLAGEDFALLLCLTLGTFLVLRLLTTVVNSLQAILVGKIVPRVLYRIKEDVFSALKHLSLKFFTDRQTGPLMTRVLGDAGEVTGFFIDGLPYLFGDVIMVIATVTIMFLLNWQLAVVAVVVVPILTLVSNWLRPMLWHLHGKRHRAARTVNGVLNDSLTGTRVIKAFGQEQTAVSGFDRASGQMADTEVSVVAYENRYFILFSLGETLLNITVWFVGAWLVIMSGQTQMSYGMLTTFISMVGFLSGPLQRMTDMFRWGTSCMNAAGRIFEIIDARPDVVEKDHSVSLEQVKGLIELQDVSFSYQPGHPVLKNISFQIQPGQMLGIVGRSGVGKSTLVSLIARLYDPDSGQIKIDGIDLRELSMETLHRCVSTVSQDSYVFMDTVANNIAYARPQATMEEIISAAIAAGAHDFICKMPDGYDTLVGSSGRQLSGGERQRLSVARAILADSPVLILDEATAAVDTATEQQIQAALSRLIRGRTTISIAHRLSTLREADQLLVIDQGEIKEHGTHEQLMEQQGIYYKLVELQTKALSLEGRQKAMEEDLIIGEEL